MVQTCVNSENGLGSCLKPQLRPHLVKFNEVFRKCRYDNNKNFIFNANFVAVRKLSGSCQAVVRQLSGTDWNSLGSHQSNMKLLSSHQTVILSFTVQPMRKKPCSVLFFLFYRTFVQHFSFVLVQIFGSFVKNERKHVLFARLVGKGKNGEL